MDIQRKWLVLALCANRSDALPAEIVNHGVLLDANRKKLSRYAGATVEDHSEANYYANARAALLSCTLGKDILASKLPISTASRLREKTVNSLKYLRIQQAAPDDDGIDVDFEMREAVNRVDQALEARDTTAALALFRKAVVQTLSNDLIPRVRGQGLGRSEHTERRLGALFTVFFGPEPRLQQ
jgi:isoleucyl-tRNA synthetase